MMRDRRDPGRWDHWLLAVGLLMLGGAGGYLIWSRIEPAWLALGLWLPTGLACAALLLVPSSRRPILAAWAQITAPIGLAVSLLVLGIIFWVLLTPVALLTRLFGRDPLRRRKDEKAASYWREYRRDQDPESDFRQY